MSIDATAGGASSDSYVDIAGAGAYFGERLWVDAWDDADVLDKEKALKWATKILEQLHWFGSLPSDTQALRWPRSYVDDLDGNWLDDTLIPGFLVQATCELAFVLISSDKTTDNAAEQLNALTIGPINLKFNSEYEASIFPEIVKGIVMPYTKSFDFEGELQSMKVGLA